MFRLMPTQINNEALFLLILNRSYYIIKRGKKSMLEKDNKLFN